MIRGSIAVAMVALFALPSVDALLPPVGGDVALVAPTGDTYYTHYEAPTTLKYVGPKCAPFVGACTPEVLVPGASVSVWQESNDCPGLQRATQYCLALGHAVPPDTRIR